MSEVYFKSKKHIENMENARLKASLKEPCIHCSIFIKKSNIMRHINSCLYNPDNLINCLECSTQILTKEKKFCNSTCAAKYNNSKRTPESRLKQSISVSKTMRGKPSHLKGKKRINPNELLRVCLTCKEKFSVSYRTSTQKYCSLSCAAVSHNKKWGRCLSIPYWCETMNEEVTLQSNWEVIVAKKLDELKIPWIRPSPISWIDSNGNSRKYFPDFYLPEYDQYLDPKNNKVLLRDKEKLENVSNKIKLSVGNLKIIFDTIESL